jgi:glucose/arabinose dehydrogenase
VAREHDVATLVTGDPPMLRFALSLVSCLGLASNALARDGDVTAPTQQGTVRLVTVAEGLEHPWGIAFLPDGRALVTERPGRLRVVATDGTLSPPLAGVPAVDAVRQGGLLDVEIDPDFSSNRLVYLSYAEKRDGGNGTTVARGRLGDRGLEAVEVIFRQQPAIGGGHHFGSRLVFARDGRLFVTLGERNSERAKAQLLDNHLGKVVRIERDGRVPADNPFVGQAGVLPEIWSYGHRNIQGAALHPATGELWTNEHGPKGGDELNRDLPGLNYGWPKVSYGVEYSGAKISDSGTGPGFESPVHYWVPSIATSGLLFYTGDRFPQWRGSAFIGGLSSKQVARLQMEGNRVVHEERLFDGVLKERVRDVEQGPDGLIYLLTDEPKGRLLRIEPGG